MFIHYPDENNSLVPGRCGSDFKTINFKIILQNINRAIALRWMPQELINEKPKLVLVKAWCHQTTRLTWPNVESDLCHHMISLGPSELTYCQLDHWDIKSWLEFKIKDLVSKRYFWNCHLRNIDYFRQTSRGGRCENWITYFSLVDHRDRSPWLPRTHCLLLHI